MYTSEYGCHKKLNEPSRKLVQAGTDKDQYHITFYTMKQSQKQNYTLQQHCKHTETHKQLKMDITSNESEPDIFNYLSCTLPR